MLLPSVTSLRVRVGVDPFDAVVDGPGCDVTLAVDDDVLAAVLEDDDALARWPPWPPCAGFSVDGGCVVELLATL